MGFKKIAVLCDVYEMSKSKNITPRSLEGDAFLKDRIFGLLDTMKRNADFKNKRRWISIKWEETAKLQLEAGNLDWVDYAIGEKELEAKTLKRAIKFPVKDSYTEALEDGEELEAYNDYISVVEGEIEILKGIEFKPVEEGVHNIDSLKAIIKDEGLGIRVSKDDTYDDVLKKIKESRDKQ